MLHISCEKPLLFDYRQPSKWIVNLTRIYRKVKTKKQHVGKGFELQTSCTTSGIDNYIHAFRYTKKSCWGKSIPLIFELLILFSIPRGRFRLLFFVSNVVDRIMAFSVTEPHSFSVYPSPLCSAIQTVFHRSSKLLFCRKSPKLRAKNRLSEPVKGSQKWVWECWQNFGRTGFSRTFGEFLSWLSVAIPRAE